MHRAPSSEELSSLTTPALSSAASPRSKTRLHPVAHCLISYGAWPGLIGLSMLWIHLGFEAELPELLIIDIVVFGSLALSLLLEKLIPYRDDWYGRSADRWLDRIHLPLTELTAQGVFRLVLVIGGFLAGAEITRLQLDGPWSQVGLDQLPWPVQLACALLIFDLALYWQHRSFHTSPFFWAFHRIHHSPRAMMAMSAIRNHPIGPFITACISLCFGLLAPPTEIFVMAHMWIVVKGWLQHANADLRTPFFDSWFATPRIHRWHHSTRAEESNSNFGLLVMVWDRFPWHRLPIIGPGLHFQRCTWFNPADREAPEAVGMEEEQVDPSRSAFQNWWGQFRSPFRIWRAQGPMRSRAMTWLGWPLGISAAIFATIQFHQLGWKAGEIGGMVALAGLLYSALLQALNPLREDWKDSGRQTRFDLLHMGLSGGTADVAVTMALAGIGTWSGWQVIEALGLQPWQALGLDQLPLALQAVLGLLVLDLGLYWQHRLMHEIPALWETHRVHHSVRTLGPTRALRHHPLSPACTALAWAVFGMLGVPVLIFLICQAFAMVNGALQHCNARLHIGILDRFFAGPSFHRWHHARDLADANTNFGPNLSVWDQVAWHRVPLLGSLLQFQYTTFRSLSDEGPPEIGLDELLMDDSRGLFANWWMQVRDPVLSWFKGIPTREPSPPVTEEIQLSA